MSKLNVKINNRKLCCEFLCNDFNSIGKEAFFYVDLNINVIDSRPINKIIRIKKESFILSEKNNFEVDLENYYCYKGGRIDIFYEAKIIYKKSAFSNETIKQKFAYKLIKKDFDGLQKTEIDKLIEPKDNFNFIHNFKAIPIANKLKTIFLRLAAIIVVSINTFIGFHDEVSPRGQEIFYSQVNSDGETSSPLVNSLVNSGILGVIIFKLIKSNLRKYMTFDLRRKDILFQKGRSYRLSELIEGKSRVDLKDIELKVVACNIEKGQYQRTQGSGKKRRTVTKNLTIPLAGTTLLHQKISFIPKNNDISAYLTGELSFDKVYDKLYPELLVNGTHGVAMHCEIQLIHNLLVDQELIIPSSMFDYKSFNI